MNAGRRNLTSAAIGSHFGSRRIPASVDERVTD
jgi:hypothetical protein